MATHVSGTEFDNGQIIPVNEILRNEQRGIYQLDRRHSSASLSVRDLTQPWGAGQTKLVFFGSVVADFSKIKMNLIRDERYEGDESNVVEGVRNGFEYWLAPGIIAVITNVSEGYGEVSLTISRTGDDFGEVET